MNASIVCGHCERTHSVTNVGLVRAHVDRNTGKRCQGSAQPADRFPLAPTVTRVADLKAADVMALFLDPKDVVQGEYSAVYEFLADAMVNADAIEEVADLPFDFANAILRQFETEIAGMKKVLHEVLKADRL